MATSTANFPGLLTPTFSRGRRRKVPIPGGARYRTTTTKGGKKVRLAFQGPGRGRVVEAKNIRTGATHTPQEFRRERARRAEANKVRTQQAKHRAQIRAVRRLSHANG